MTMERYLMMMLDEAHAFILRLGAITASGNPGFSEETLGLLIESGFIPGCYCVRAGEGRRRYVIFQQAIKNWLEDKKVIVEYPDIDETA